VISNTPNGLTLHLSSNSTASSELSNSGSEEKEKLQLSKFGTCGNQRANEMLRCLG